MNIGVERRNLPGCAVGVTVFGHHPKRLESGHIAWDIPIVKLISDSRGRIYAPTLFPPGRAFEAEPQADGSVRVVQLRETDVPIVKPVREGDLLMLPIEVDPEIIVSAIKADREG